MPGDRVHTSVGLLLLPILAYAVLKVGLPATVFIATYIFSLLWLSPDIDLENSKSMKRWGILRFIWLPYAKLFRHRGISHNIVLGPLTRLIYLLIIAGFVYSLFRMLGFEIVVGVAGVTTKENVLAFLAGFWLPDVLHVFLDRIDEFLKRKK
jgi:uncharacterized metal-binding protein